MKTKYIITLIILSFGFSFYGCEEVDVESLAYENSSFKEVRMYLREIVDDHASMRDLTVTSEVKESTNLVIVTVKTGTDVTKLFAVAKLESGCTVESVNNSSEFGTVADFSNVQKYLVKSSKGTAREWIVKVKVAPPLVIK